MKRLKFHKAFTLIEVLIDVFVITAVFGALMGTFLLTLRTVNSGKVRTAATALANEQMESLRNLPYDALATQHGTVLPQGNIPDQQILTRSGVSYDLTTQIITVDDPYDGCAIPQGTLYVCTDGQTSSTQDTVPVDYKRISVQVKQHGKTQILAQLVSNASAKAAETSGNTGILLIVVNDANGVPVEGATVTITDPNTGVSITGLTNSAGQLLVANVPPDNQNGYHIVVTMNGYSTDYTTPRTSQNPNQIQPDVDVSAQKLTTQTLTIDHLSNLQAKVLDTNNQPISGVLVTATSTKTTQFNPDQPKNVYTATTDATGTANFTNIEWDSYTLTVPSNYVVVVTSPYQAVGVDPGTTQTATLIVSTSASASTLTSVSPTSGASGQTVTVVMQGSNFPSSSTVLLRRTGYSDIAPTSTSVASNQKSITAVFNLTGATAGDWDIVITTPTLTIIEKEGFTIS